METSSWDDEELFGDPRPPRGAPPQPVVSYAPPSRKEQPKTMAFERLPRMMSARTSPLGWVCNARKEHSDKGYVWVPADSAPQSIRCKCQHCLLVEHPYLELGEPWPPMDQPWLREKLANDYVGIYEPMTLMEVETPCSVCGGVIKLDGKTAAKFCENEEYATHVDCLSDVDSMCLNALVGVQYALPYIIRKRIQKEECDGPGDEEPSVEGDSGGG